MLRFFLLLMLPLFVLAMDPMKVMYVTYNLKEREFKAGVEAVRKSMEAQKLKVLRTLTISDAIRARGNQAFRNYYVVFGCEFEGMDRVLLKAPALSNVVPCSVAVYEEGGRVKATVVNHSIFLTRYRANLTLSERRAVSDVYRRLHSALAKISTNRPIVPQIPPLKEDLVYEEVVEGIDFETFKTLYKTSLDGVNMNILDIMDVRRESPKFSIFLACNLSYGEAILKDIPQFGTLAPCRVYLYEKNGKVATGYINIPFLLKTYGKHLSKENAEIFKRADQDIKQALKETKGE
ncbi:MAG: DUF302 domain-containing protein [Aquificaceae bacterium]|nr:DUF302 domain-containing protein [Aquificaceae bacterium]MDW8423347.1 DUF302 domain-containing protein [Aquificaceae bacterium]